LLLKWFVFMLPMTTAANSAWTLFHLFLCEWMIVKLTLLDNHKKDVLQYPVQNFIPMQCPFYTEGFFGLEIFSGSHPLLLLVQKSHSTVSRGCSKLMSKVCWYPLFACTYLKRKW
jgi:hypothetical protein